MSSDIILRRSTPSSEEESARLTIKPFYDICDRVFEIATTHGNRSLAEIAMNAKSDDYLDLHDMDDGSLALVEQAISDALGDEEFFSWQTAWQRDPIFIARCRRQNTSPLEESLQIREMTTRELTRLVKLLRNSIKFD